MPTKRSAKSTKDNTKKREITEKERIESTAILQKMFKRVKDICDENAPVLVREGNIRAKDEGKGAYVCIVHESDDYWKDDWQAVLDYRSRDYLLKNGFYSTTKCAEKVQLHNPETQFVLLILAKLKNELSGNYCQTFTVHYHSKEVLEAAKKENPSMAESKVSTTYTMDGPVEEKPKEGEEKKDESKPDGPNSIFGEQMVGVCLTCGVAETRVPLKSCSGCKLAFYCSVECQKDDWKRSHKRYCEKIKQMSIEYEQHVKVNGDQHGTVVPDFKTFMESFTTKFSEFPNATVKHKVVSEKSADGTKILADYLDTMLKIRKNIDSSDKKEQEKSEESEKKA